MSKRILMVEDTEDNRQIVRDLVATTDFELIKAADGAAGVAAATAEKPDLILMDIQLCMRRFLLNRGDAAKHEPSLVQRRLQPLLQADHIQFDRSCRGLLR